MKLVIAAMVASTAIVLAAPAHADTDPHLPNPFSGSCAGGGAGNAWEGYCDGERPLAGAIARLGKV